MSTFDGIVEEFPNIRIDHFRYQSGKTPPAACFLSHVHSDHLLGLETLKMPFVYCSAATRQILLKMEKYPHRINFSKGILEARRQTYKHLKTILRPLPLQSPVDLELGPKNEIRVTLFDANHCPGAVMFLIEGDGKAILYTGDVRAESWWVNSITRNPILIPYATGQKRIDCMYLDTTFASHQDIHREFPSKAEGLAELTKKVMRYSSDSIFYFRAWTLGYEDVWTLLSNLLRSQIHVDQYQLRLFQAVSEDGPDAYPGPVLTGFQVGNSVQPGCLTTDSSAKIHSCEPGTPCHGKLKKNPKTIWITPIISRLRDGTEVAEIGAGGGKGDLYQQCEVDLINDSAIESLRVLCRKMATNKTLGTKLEAVLSQAQSEQNHRLFLDKLGLNLDIELTIMDFLKMLAGNENASSAKNVQRSNASNVIHFPYSRHSSYSELRHLISMFRPRDICPCTVDLHNWDERELSMESLFGDICSGKRFKYDKAILEEVERRRYENETGTEHTDTQQQDTQRTETMSEESQSRDQIFKSAREIGQQEFSTDAEREATKGPETEDANLAISISSTEDHLDKDGRTPKERLYDAWRAANDGSDIYIPSGYGKVLGLDQGQQLDYGTREVSLDDLDDVDGGLPRSRRVVGLDGVSDGSTSGPIASLFCSSDYERRREAFEAARRCLDNGDNTSWSELRLRSLGWEGHTKEEIEL